MEKQPEFVLLENLKGRYKNSHYIVDPTGHYSRMMTHEKILTHINEECFHSVELLMLVQKTRLEDPIGYFNMGAAISSLMSSTKIGHYDSDLPCIHYGKDHILFPLVKFYAYDTMYFFPNDLLCIERAEEKTFSCSTFKEKKPLFFSAAGKMADIRSDFEKKLDEILDNYRDDR